MYLLGELFSKNIAKPLNGMKPINGMRMFPNWAREEIALLKRGLKKKESPYHRKWTEDRLASINGLAEAGICLEITNKEMVRIQHLSFFTKQATPFSIFVEPRKGKLGESPIYKGRMGYTGEKNEWITGAELWLY